MLLPLRSRVPFCCPRVLFRALKPPAFLLEKRQSHFRAVLHVGVRSANKEWIFEVQKGWGVVVSAGCAVSPPGSALG